MDSNPHTVDPDPLSHFNEFYQYPWCDDAEFVSGLEKIQGYAKADPQIVLKAKQFFFARKRGIDIDLNGYRQWLESKGEAAGISSEDQETDHLTYEQIVDLIVAGKPIPGIKQIPSTVLGAGASSSSKAAPRKKPWE